MFKVIMLTLILSQLSFPETSASASTARGTVSHRISGCDHFVVNVGSSGFMVMEWYGGYDPDKGDRYIGPSDEYGFEDVYFNGSETQVYIDDWGLDLEDALEKVVEECD